MKRIDGFLGMDADRNMYFYGHDYDNYPYDEGDEFGCEIGYIFIPGRDEDDFDNGFEIPKEDFLEAIGTKVLIHPQTGDEIKDFPRDTMICFETTEAFVALRK